MTLDDILQQLAATAVADLSQNAFQKFWDIATTDRRDTVAVGADGLEAQRLAELRHLHASDRLRTFIGAWIAARQPPEIASFKAISSYLVFGVCQLPDAAAVVAPAQQSDLAEKQRILDLWGTFYDEQAFAALIWNVFPRVCCIVGKAQLMENNAPAPKDVGGTGFLVGPDTIMTNWHVVEHLLDTTGQKRPDSEKEFAVFFDHRRQERILRHDEDVRDTVRVLPASDWFLGGSRSTVTRADLSSAFDFALIKLSHEIGKSAADGRFGAPRGWFRIPSADKLSSPEGKAGLLCPQHAGGFGRVFGFGQMCGMYFGAQNRIAYEISTVKGSSGSPILAKSGELLGIHEADDKGAEQNDPKRPHNRGVLLAGFADEARKCLPQADDEPKPIIDLAVIRTRSDRRHPLIGRNAFSAWIEDQLQDEPTTPSVRVIMGGRNTGKSFSIDILRARTGTSKDIVLPFAPSSLAAGRDAYFSESLLFPERPDFLLVEIAKVLGLRFDGIPPPPPEVETRATELGSGQVDGLKPNEWASTSLTNWLLGAMKAKGIGREKRYWIVFDMSDEMRLTPAMTSFLKSMTAGVDKDHPFDIFRWLYLQYDPSFLAPAQKVEEILKPNEDITSQHVGDFLANMFLAVRGSVPVNLIDESLDFIDPIKRLAPEAVFWQILVASLGPKISRHLPAAEA